MGSGTPQKSPVNNWQFWVCLALSVRGEFSKSSEMTRASTIKIGLILFLLVFSRTENHKIVAVVFVPGSLHYYSSQSWAVSFDTVGS